MDARTIDTLESIDSSQETTDLIERWRNTVKPGVYRLSNGKWKKYHETKFLRNERKTIEERLLEIISRLESTAVEIRNRPIHNQPQNDYLPDWQFTGARNFEGEFIPKDANQPSTSTARPEEAPIEEAEISSDSEMAPSVLEVPTINWANYLVFNTSRWDTRQEYEQLNPATGTTKTPSGKPKKSSQRTSSY